MPMSKFYTSRPPKPLSRFSAQVSRLFTIQGVVEVGAAVLSRSGAVRVKADETVAHFDLMNASGVGLLIQAVVGSFGGAGFWCRNRAGLAV